MQRGEHCQVRVTPAQAEEERITQVRLASPRGTQKAWQHSQTRFFVV
jgi:hypothetical protein